MSDQSQDHATNKPRWWRRIRTWHAVVFWGLAIAPLTLWGLPSRAHDDLLFGGEPAWPASKYDVGNAFQTLQTRAGGADTDINPLASAGQITNLTEDDAARGAILLRYRLYSRQPDEMITFRALARMHPRQGDFDPHLYQYGGGYIYLVGAALGAAAALGLTHLTRDLNEYVAQPEDFARFYVVARCVSLVFGALALIAVSKLARRAGGRTAGWLALVLLAATPVFITDVLEAKPHLPSACLALWATLSALDYYRGGRTRDVVRMGLQAGYSFGLVLFGAVTFLLWPALLIARKDSGSARWRALALSGGLFVGVYVLTNPYIPYNFLFNRAALTSNVSNSVGMYRDRLSRVGEGAIREASLLVSAVGPELLTAAAVGLVVLLWKYPQRTILAAAPGVGVLLVCAFMAAGKPAEFGRFLILPAMLLCVAGGVALAALHRRHAKTSLIVVMVIVATAGGPAYIRSFATDAFGKDETRYLAGLYMRDHISANSTIGLLQEPAPYSVPPLNFAQQRIVLLPPSRPAGLSTEALPEWLVFTADDERSHAGDWWQGFYHLQARFPNSDLLLSPIAWADKPVFIYRCKR